MSNKPILVIVTAAAAFAAIAISVGTAQAATHQVHITNFAFAPGNVTVNIGDTVSFTNMDPHDHDVTFQAGFDSGGAGSLSPNEVFNHTFDTAGTFAFRCTLHSSNFTDGMIGKIIVRAAVPASDHYVELGDVTFDPSSLTIQPGETVTWINNATFTHDILFEAGFGTGAMGSLAAGATYSHTFPDNGTFRYRCQMHSGGFEHSQGMVGVVIVGDGGTPPTPAPGFLPGFEAPLVALAVLGAAGVAATLGRTRR